MRLTEPAPAKLNLALHVRGRRDDGYHELDTLFAFCTDGDLLHVDPSDALSLDIEGPFAADLAADGDNLVIKAARALAAAAAIEAKAALTLEKKLPIASGVGGGSADAAAALRLLTRYWAIDPTFASSVAPRLGADVPACLLSMTARGSGVGEVLQLVDEPGLSGTPTLLVNPRQPLSTAAVFRAWDGADHGPIGDWREGRNDLEAGARALVPEIGAVLEWLAGQRGVLMSCMSGSGATCFALFDGEQSRDDAAAACPDKWWHLSTFLR